ncbi:MAG TPA: nuclear transport factor 2 family protein, partial [Polyangiaceae bacterium]|nr:nuclear transport factor 2 family protein [Polyangiaceae bacterium]
LGPGPPRALRYAPDMLNPVELAVDTYVRAVNERDPAARAAMIDACFASDARMVTRSREIRGRHALAAELDRFLADPRLLRIRLVSAIDARGTTFRYRAVADFRDGSSPENFDAGEIDTNGQISLILTFAGPLQDAAG